jgi:hypothetical protein
MGVTKRPKRVKLDLKTYVHTEIEYRYTCPACYTEFWGHTGITANTIRFRCTCGQELIVEEKQS